MAALCDHKPGASKAEGPVNVDKELDEEIDEAVGEGADGKRARLDPDEYFGRELIIDQAKARRYEQALKEELMKWVMMGKEGDQLMHRAAGEVLDRLKGAGNHCERAERIAEERGGRADGS
eukprot:gene6586-17857_t